MIEPLIITSSFLFGREVLSQTVSVTTKSIYEGIDNILLNDNFQFKKTLENLDINVKLDIVNEFISDIDDKHITKTSMKMLKHLETILLLINKEIKNINIEIENHQLKWFSKLRYSECSTMIKNLVNHVKILDERFNLLLKLINI